MNYRHWLTALACATSAVGSWAQTTVFGGTYRIPSMLHLPDGKIVAFSDFRPQGGDVGQSETLQNDIVAKVWDGQWGAETTLLKAGQRDNGRLFSFGDAATAYDESTGRILLVCAYGDVCYWNSTLRNPIGIHRAYFHIEGDALIKDSVREITPDFYRIFGGTVHKTFFTSGRICQSRTSAKPLAAKRLYASVASNLGSLVVFSDDFGLSWRILGGDGAQPAPQGDEAKVVELPNGDVLLSCRARDADGRYLNIFHFSDIQTAKGSWEQPVLSADEAVGGLHGARCNGETLLVPVRTMKEGRPTNLLLQSIPFGTDRTRVGIYFKECGNGPIKVADLATGWQPFAVSSTYSAYSTMTLNGKNGVDLLYEEDLNGPNPDNYNYNIKYQSLPIQQITDNQYVYDTSRK